jgi:hypothetical protein
LWLEIKTNESKQMNFIGVGSHNRIVRAVMRVAQANGEDLSMNASARSNN